MKASRRKVASYLAMADITRILKTEKAELEIVEATAPFSKAFGICRRPRVEAAGLQGWSRLG
jgi:hypothetical protein